MSENQTSESKKDSGENAESDKADPREERKRKRKRRLILIGLAILFVLVAVVWLLLNHFVFSQRETTDDAYVGGDQVVISSRVSGTVIAVLADDTQRVTPGQVLVRLDPTDAEVALAKASSALAQAVRQTRQQTERASQDDAAVASRRLELSKALKDLKRREPLLVEHAIAREQVAHAQDTVATAREALNLAMRQAAAEHSLIDGTSIADNPMVLQAKAAFRAAWVNKERDAIVSPIGGYVAQRSVQVGSRVQPGQALLMVVPLNHLWVEANFKEGQLAHIRLGQPVEVDADMYDDVHFHGRVEGLAAGTGSAFSLLPAQNASGNWIKVVQRVPVRIALDPNELAKHPLRVGLSADVNVDTSDRSGDVLADVTSSAPAGSHTDVYAHDMAKAESAADAVIAANMGSLD
ncbi:MAG: efflux RND transporter periplasmic adaptor subunit [Rhodanobacteraceae bacterium]